MPFFGLYLTGFGPERPAIVSPPGAIDCSDSYKYWDQTETGTVTICGIWSGETSSYGERVFTDVILKRTRRATKSMLSGIMLQANNMFWMIPAALTDALPIRQGDKVTVSGITWIATGDSDLIHAGTSPSHTLALFAQER